MNERQSQKLTVLYLRLSKDDIGENAESNSIKNQRRMLEEYAERNGLTPYISISDDGRSGTNYERPGWQELMELVEADKVGAIILKSLDRMGRNYLESGMLREVFTEKGIRLIAVNDGVDTFDFIRTSVVRKLVLETIRRTCGYVRENEAEFIAKLREASEVRQADAAKSHKRTIAKNEKRIAELDRLFIRIYEDNTAGKLTDERFAQMSAAYDGEQADLKAQNEILRAELESFERDSLNADNFLALVRRYTEFDELTTELLNNFVDRILVHEADKSTGERRQEVEIHLNYIGRFTIPGDEPKPLTPEEITAERERLEKKRKKNENLRAWRAKRKAAAQAAQAG